MTKLTLALTAAIIALITAPSFAQDVGKQGEIVTKNVKPATEVEAPAPAPVLAGTQKCVLVTLVLPVIDTKQKPASYSPTVRDSTDGLLEAMKACNPKNEVAEVKKGSTKTAKIKVSQGADGSAYLKLPADRVERLLVGFYFKSSDWKQERYWAVNGPVGKQTELVMQAQDEKSAPKVH